MTMCRFMIQRCCAWRRWMLAAAIMMAASVLDYVVAKSPSLSKGMLPLSSNKGGDRWDVKKSCKSQDLVKPK